MPVVFIFQLFPVTSECTPPYAATREKTLPISMRLQMLHVENLLILQKGAGVVTVAFQASFEDVVMETKPTHSLLFVMRLTDADAFSAKENLCTDTPLK